jgi:thiamine biosynthesis lipoprotein
MSASAELSDALATAVFVMGPEIGVDLVNQLPGIHALVVNESNTIFTTRHLKLNRYEEAFV